MGKLDLTVFLVRITFLTGTSSSSGSLSSTRVTSVGTTAVRRDVPPKAGCAEDLLRLGFGRLVGDIL